MRTEPSRDWFVLDLARVLDVQAARLYPPLAGLERDGVVASGWVRHDGIRRRRYWLVDVQWTCPCGYMNDTLVCTKCGKPREAAA